MENKRITRVLVFALAGLPLFCMIEKLVFYKFYLSRFQQLSTALSRAMDGYGQLFVVALDHGLRVAWWTVFLDSENILILVQDASKSQN